MPYVNASEFKRKWKYHATLPPRLVYTPEQENALGEGWTDTYQHQHYPKWVFPDESAGGQDCRFEDGGVAKAGRGAGGRRRK